ncbi:anti-phage defense-associated sirtuin Dsr1 [Methylococcus capsulatus]|uniref:Deacetylase sirtuin-type domain-containing protein n=1 Tax=Methylococcus capsulatus TaxID=414 RepID=A0AA35XYJ3_METCP|nr:anti-phage defense-associated sirtuin Dsr1 [Methylococcus capsulatus]CAI8816475.1 Deacetylase sirtuin-type domain-containing protein [Methylococcus capsulatus]
MQFVTHGPDIPDALLQAHEDGRVVFFCGAGISYPAGLPGFEGLVRGVMQRNGEPPDATEDDLLRHEQFDRALGLYEHRLQGGRSAVRRWLPDVLTPDLTRPRALTTHVALLALARNRRGGIKLVTTNFDRLFEVAADRQRLPSFTVYPDPPARARWEGLVHLHGRMPADPSRDDLDRLVLSDGDFGQAYLTHGWAARFVAGLFRDYALCFVGYSISDPVLRYMTAAQALDGEAQLYAFAPVDASNAESAERAWRTKHVTPITYSTAHGHRALHRTLQVWASIYRDGVRGKERIVARYVHRAPNGAKPGDNFVSRMLWALSDPSGLPARRFAEFNPVPSLDWLLDAFAADRYGPSDLARFGVPPRDNAVPDLRFSLIHRPAPYPLAPPMHLVADGIAATQWDDVMFQLARWLVRHLNDPRLVLWIAERGGQLHRQWSRQIEQRLDELARLERDGKTSELEDIRAHAPNAVPGPLMRTLWRLLLGGRVKSPGREPDFYQWQSRLQREGLTATLRLELRELLSPKVRLLKLFYWDEEPASADELSHLRQLVYWEPVLTADHAYPALRHMADAQWQAALPALLEDMQLLLRDALDLLRELGEADEHGDRSHRDLPSISPHWQNRGVHKWVALIELLRDAWLAVRSADGARAARIAAAWFELPYPTFKRLALFAATQDGCIAPEQWVEWLLADGAWWLWAVDTQREVLRLLVLQGHRLTPESQERLESAILAGPPREMYRDDLEPDQWQELVAHSVWLRLAKLNASGLALGAAGAARLAELSRLHPQWQLAANERDEFSHWASCTGDPDYEERCQVDIAPRKRRDLVQWLVKPQTKLHPLYEDTWRDVCRARFFHSLFALCDLAQDGVWPAGRWHEALQTWAEEGLVLRSWRYAAPLVQTMPDTVLQKIAHGVTWWMEAASKPINRHEGILVELCRRMLALPLEVRSGTRIIRNGVETYDPVGSAISHPIGHVTQALINLWFKRNPNDNDLLPADIQPMFTALCDVQVERFRHGRVLLGSRLIAFFRVDRPWTERHLVPLFSWSNPVEAKAVWGGFLWSPRLYQPLLSAFKSQFLDSANHYADLGEYRQRFAAFLTYAALGPVDGYTAEEWRTAIAALPLEGLQESAQALVQALEGAADQREEYWKNRIQPFWQNVWPKSRDLATPKISESLARLCIAAGSEFPAALSAVLNWLQPIEHPYYVILPLRESGLCGRFPVHALRLLAAIVTDQPWGAPEVGKCLDLIVQADAGLAQDPNYQSLREYARRRGG